MLAAANRLGDASSFREVTRRGRRAGSRTLVVHALGVDRSARQPDEHNPAAEGASFGLVVSRAVGNSVVRNRVKRRLRHLLRERVELMAPDCRVVVRALPAASRASSAGLAKDLDLCFSRVLSGPDGPDGRGA